MTESLAKEILSGSRIAQVEWGRLSLSSRTRILRGFADELYRHMDEGVRILHEELGKPELESLTGDFLMVLEFIRASGKMARKALRPSSLPSPKPFFFGAKFRIEYSPYGVVLVMGPWNYPLQLSLIPSLSALLVGNAVILKPSEVTPKLNRWLRERISASGFPKGVFEFVEGGAESAKALIDARPDRIFLTGSPATGRAVLAQAAPHLIPVDLELGGKDAMIVFADAPLERSARAAVYGASMNAGQVCVGVKRIYVEERILPQWLERLRVEVASLRVSTAMDADVGRLARAHESDRTEAQLQSALRAGARLETPYERDGLLWKPVFVSGVPDDAPLARDEVFGPVTVLFSFRSEEEVTKRVNEIDLGLSASVWSRDKERALRVARALRVGSACVNDVIRVIANVEAPFGGVRESGMGRTHGVEGLRSFCASKTILIGSLSRRREINWFPYTVRKTRELRAVMKFRYGRGGPFRLLRDLLRRSGNA